MNSMLQCLLNIIYSSICFNAYGIHWFQCHCKCVEGYCDIDLIFLQNHIPCGSYCITTVSFYEDCTDMS